MLAGRHDRLMAPAIAAKRCVRTPRRPTASTASAPRRRSRGGGSQQFMTRDRDSSYLLLSSNFLHVHRARYNQLCNLFCDPVGSWYQSTAKVDIALRDAAGRMTKKSGYR